MIRLCLISDTLIYQISNLLINNDDLDDLEDRHIKYNIALFNHHNYDILNMYSCEDYPDMGLFISHLFTDYESDCYVLFRGVLHSLYIIYIIVILYTKILMELDYHLYIS